MVSSLRLYRQKGLSLIEVLVALVIFAFGMLGAAGLQIATLKSNKFSVSSAVAISLAREYGELMQTFPNTALTKPAGSGPLFIDTDALTGTTAALCTGISATCTTDQLAQASLDDWSIRVRAALPAGRAQVCRTSEPLDSAGDLKWGGCDNVGDLVFVKIGWLARNGKGEKLFDGSDRPKILLPLLGNLRDFASP